MWKIFLLISFFSHSYGNDISGDVDRRQYYRQNYSQRCSGNVSDDSQTVLDCLPWPYRSGPPGNGHLRAGYCATYDKDTGITSLAACPYFLSDVFELQEDEYVWYVQLPQNICALNDFMCEPMNRKGRLCSECKDGYGLAVMSTGFQMPCSKCTGAWYTIPLYLFMEFVPITVFYLIILIFKINVTSAPMVAYIVMCQHYAFWWSFSFIGEDLRTSRRMFMLSNHLDLFMKVVFSVYDMWNLHFFRNLVPLFCISSKIRPFHVGLLGYISIFYPLCLIAVTWISIELHDRNFKPLVWLLRPFNRCFLRFSRRWNKKSDIIDVFASFFLFSFRKTMYQTYFFVLYQWIQNRSRSCHLLKYSYVTNADLSVPWSSSDHLAYLIPAIIICFIFMVLPTLLLLLYPFKIFRICLSKCKLDGPVLNTFVEKFYGCYRDGLDGGTDMRSFAALYFLLSPVLAFGSGIGSLGEVMVSNNDPYFLRSIVLAIATMLIALCRPYKKTYMNVVDILLLVHATLIFHLISAYPGFQIHSHFVYCFFVMGSLPFVGFLLSFAYRVFRKAGKLKPFPVLSRICTSWYRYVIQCMHMSTQITEQPLIASANINNYGSNINASQTFDYV